MSICSMTIRQTDRQHLNKYCIASLHLQSLKNLGSTDYSGHRSTCMRKYMYGIKMWRERLKRKNKNLS